MAIFEFWISGINIYARDTDAPGLKIQRTARGANITQDGGTSNWFHLAILSPTFLDDCSVEHYDAMLKGEVNEAATIDQFQIHQAHQTTCIFQYGGIKFSNELVDVRYDIPNEYVQSPIVISIHITFEKTFDANGKVIDPYVFISAAGIRFDEK